MEKKDSPQKAAMREMMRAMMSVLLEGALDEELNEELGYSKYDYRNKDTDNSRNGHSSKNMHISYGEWMPLFQEVVMVNGDYEPQRRMPGNILTSGLSIKVSIVFM